MAAPVVPLQPLKLPAGPSPVTAEQRYWRSFKSQQLTPSPQSSPVTHISHPNTISSTSPTTSSNPPSDLFAVTAGTRIRIFSTRTRKLLKTISRFGVTDTAHSGEIRPSDGQALVAGGDSGAVQVFRTESRAILKTWNTHKQPVWCTKWNPNSSTSLLSCSDDRTVRLWDLSETDPITTFTGHQDYVRSGAFLPGQPNILVTGSYDQTVRLWDARAYPDRAVMTFAHAAPIETVLPLPSPSGSSSTILSASGSTITVLDLLAARPLEILRSHHQKTITSLALASNGTRILSAALDGHLKVFDTTSWRVVASSKYASPILSLSVIPAANNTEDRHLAVGLQSGLFSLKTRLSGAQKVAERNRSAELTALAEGQIEAYDAKKARQARLAGKPQGIRKRLRGIDDEGTGAALVVDGRGAPRKKKMRPWDEALRAGKYAKALDLVLEPSQRTTPQGNTNQPSADPNAVLTLLTALQHRSALTIALSNRNAASLTPILTWLLKHVVDPRHTVLITRTAMLVLELYAGELGQSAVVDGLIERMHERARELVEGAQVAESTRGMLEGVMRGG